MKSFEELLPTERAVLLVWGKELNYSTTAHLSIKKVNKKIKSTHPKYLDKSIRRINKMLKSSGFILEHPARRDTTYSLSPEGRRCCLILRDEEDEVIS